MSLGLILNEEKSDLVPSQNFVFIGMEFLTHKNIVRVPLDRVQGILELLLWFKKQKQVLARVCLSLLGKLSAAAQFVVLGKLHLRPLQMALFAQWKPHVLPLEYLSSQCSYQEAFRMVGQRFILGVTLKPSLPTHSLPQMRTCLDGEPISNRKDCCFMELGLQTNQFFISML